MICKSLLGNKCSHRMYFSENTAELSCIGLKLTILEVHGIMENATYRKSLLHIHEV